MKKVPAFITFATLYALFFWSAPIIGISDRAIFAIFLLSPLVVAYMVYVILKYGTPSSYTFDERFYDDFKYIRNGKEEMDAR